jgi:hypothetical protein
MTFHTSLMHFLNACSRVRGFNLANHARARTSMSVTLWNRKYVVALREPKEKHDEIFRELADSDRGSCPHNNFAGGACWSRRLFVAAENALRESGVGQDRNVAVVRAAGFRQPLHRRDRQ